MEFEEVKPLEAARDVARLLGVMWFGRDLRLRVAAVHALGRLGDVRAVNPLIEALDDLDMDMRRAASLALGRLGEPAVDPLIRVLERTGRSTVREAAASALGTLGAERAVEPLVEVLGDAEVRTQEAAARALVNLGSAAVNPLVGALKHGDSGVRWNATQVLGKIGDRRAVPYLL